VIFVDDKHHAGGQSNLDYVLRRLHIDPVLLALVFATLLVGGIILYSASGASSSFMYGQSVKILLALGIMLLIAQINPAWMRRGSPWLYAAGLAMLVFVLVGGVIGGGAQRWIDIGFRFQPSEIMKLALPAMLAWLLHSRSLPPSPLLIVSTLILIAMPVVLVLLQPDLGTAILIGLTGATIVFLAGIGLVYIFSAVAIAGAALPALWFFVMHDYQKRRVLTLFDPEKDPLGAGYHIIQSKIAIGSGGVFGKGWLSGSQGQLEFLPERSTDFIFAVIGEEFGLFGAISILLLYLAIVGRGFYIAATAQDTFSRLLAGSISFTFFFYVFVNSAMVTGLIPVVGVPLPLISAGGTSLVTLMAGFGILMSIHTHRRLLPR
jgi:rod shape determining protein RodA|tara:strand:+ start:1185 stop:2315 length:1131 start_codon:yes stop_codon:yes gene_type:complete